LRWRALEFHPPARQVPNFLLSGAEQTGWRSSLASCWALPDAAALLIGSVGTQLSPPRRARLLVSADSRGRVDVVGNVAVDGNVDRTSIATKPGQASVSGRYLLGLQ
jgi:hypothetical protein